MAKKEELHFRRGDFLAIAAVVLLAAGVLLCYLPKDRPAPVTVQVYEGGEKIRELPLDQAQTFVVGNCTITVAEGTVAVTESDCPDQDCVHMGPVSTSGRSIVCLPNAVEVRVVNAPADVDFVVG